MSQCTQLFVFSELQFSHLWYGDPNTWLAGWLWKLLRHNACGVLGWVPGMQEVLNTRSQLLSTGWPWHDMDELLIISEVIPCWSSLLKPMLSCPGKKQLGDCSRPAVWNYCSCDPWLWTSFETAVFFMWWITTCNRITVGWSHWASCGASDVALTVFCLGLWSVLTQTLFKWKVSVCHVYQLGKLLAASSSSANSVLNKCSLLCQR